MFVPDMPVLVWKDSDSLAVKPFRIIGDIYYVGNLNVSSYLIRGSTGAILIDTGFHTTVPLLLDSLAEVGVELSDIKAVVHTHGHVDHCGGSKQIKELTGGKTYLHESDVEQVENGTELTCAKYFYDIDDFQTFRVDVPFRDADIIEVSDKKLRVLHTPGHTKGCCSFLLEEQDFGRKLTVLFIGGLGQWTFDSRHRSQGYDGDMEDYQKTICILKNLDVDVFLTSHPNRVFVRQEASFEKGRQAFIDPKGYREYIQETEVEFLDDSIK
jgi:metallo-beta-lactamase class B